MRRNINNVEIVEPPIGELTKKYSAFSAIKRACFTGCGCLVFVIIGIIIFIRIAMGSGPETLSSVPANFPSNIPLYDKDNIEQITFISGKYKNRGIEIAAIFPKIILSPLLITMDKNTQANADTDKLTSITNLWKMISAPVSDHRDTIQIEWRELNADPFFIIGYYKTELKKQAYNIDVESEGEGVQQFSFSKDDITGSMYVQGAPGQGADYAVLTVNLKTETSTST
ncbi:MAG: hypothetical protein A2563_01275 [Candidatus Magasanikbacteria bacterium RIFOXYD1_FULL_40_23]|uniref:Uncharacterized protein n=1 Tax=Candidatus Magasanikbacteria bacterium RIFOXYD1_FULL_40_23 TaxID=1798705 RepID=A0A1F6PB06_9BACT|nr:MAG: hypothetical protein A2563_01275 [Candidatus Magasanikbacteria bacterium RIFOXYD1_FULL_40_23]